ncbi:MAG TPA: TetR/AcrR family transcriptional regulator [Pyrinomonadaceae bacterium]|nr:TetR/AcrR family transcriptional regulator [Pyrinomonadaceae bacterium]
MIKENEINEATGRMSGDERRSQILQIAIKLFSQKGFSGATTKEIAREAGVSEAMVFRHFATKSELYHAIINFKACEGGVNKLPWEDDSTETAAIEAKDDFRVFYNLALHALAHHESDIDFMRLLLHSALDEHELSEMFFDQFLTPLYEFLGSYISKRQKDGVMREGEPKIFIRAFLGMIIHHSLNNILWDKSRRLLNISNEEAARSFTEILLNGVLREK